METCKYGSGAGKRKPTAVKRKGVVCRAYNEVSFWSGGRNGGTINAQGDKSFNGENGPAATADEFGGYQPIGDFIVDFHAPAQRNSFIREIRMVHESHCFI